MTNKKQDSGRTMIEVIAVLILVAIITLGGIFGFSWLVQSYQKKEDLKHANTVIVTLQNSRIIRKSDPNKPISIKSVVSGPKTAEEGKVMVLSDKDDYFMVVTAMGTEEYIADLQIEPGTCSEYMQAFNEHSALFNTDDTIITSSADSFLSDIKTKNSGKFEPLSPEIIKNCEETGRFRAAFNVISKLNEGKEVHLKGKEFIVECPSGTKEDKNGNCCAVKECGNLCKCPSDKPHCENGNCVECTENKQCGDYQICDVNECVCKETFTPYQGECVCEPGYTPKDGTCQPCDKGTYKASIGNGFCSDCDVGKYQDDKGQASCKDCDANKTTDRTGATASTECKCPSDRPKWNDTKNECEPCPANAEWSNNQCVCDAGYTWNGTTCQPCAKGTYKDKPGNGTCTLCPVGKYQNETGKTQCIDCGGGRTTDKRGATASTECKCPSGQNWWSEIMCCPANSIFTTLPVDNQCLCNPGYTWKNGTCQPCDKGTSKLIHGNQACDACPKGYYQDKTGQASCTLCPVGKYQNETGKTQCIDCGGGRTTDKSGSIASTDCKCPEDKPYWNATSKTCVPCSRHYGVAGDGYQCPSDKPVCHSGKCKTCTELEAKTTHQPTAGRVKTIFGISPSDPSKRGCYLCKNDKTGNSQDIGCPKDYPICPTDSGKVYNVCCPTSKPKWNGTECVQCTSHSECDAGKYCNNGTCSACGAGHSCGCSWCSNGNGGCFSLDQWCKRNSDGNYSAMDENKCGKGTCQTKDWNRSGWTKRCVTWGDCWLKKDSNGDSYCNYWYSENPQSCSACGRGQACRW